MGNIIVDLWRQQPGDYFFLSTKSATGKWTDHAIKRSDLKNVDDMIASFSKMNTYFCPHGFNKPRRLKDYAVPPKMLYADLDSVDPRKAKVRPTIAIESSPGRYVGLWLSDKPVTEELNRRLAYHLGSDKSGWDFSQVLRVPNTTNFKYKTMPRVRMLWLDGPTYTLKELEKLVPPVKGEGGGDDYADANDAYEKYSKELHLNSRNLLTGRTPVQEGKRSEVQLKLYMELHEAGASVDEIFAILWACPWQKFDTEKKLRRDIERAVGKSSARPFGKKSIPQDGDSEEVDELWDAEDELTESGLPTLGVVEMSDVEATEYDWVFHPFFARKEMTVLQGDPKVGKSYFLQMVAGAITKGKRLPSEHKMTPVKGKVLYFDPENLPDKVTKKRLEWNGIDGKDFLVVPIAMPIADKAFRDRVQELMEEHEPVMVVFDTVMHYAVGDTNKASDMTKLNGWFMRLARRYDCSVVILRHMNKAAGRDSGSSGQGSKAFEGVTRLLVSVGWHPDDKDVRVVTSSKGSMLSNKIRVPSFTIESAATLKEQDRSVFEWQGLIEMDADYMVAKNMQPTSTDGTDKKKTATEIIRAAFENHDELSYAELKQIVEKSGEVWPKDSALKRAATNLNIQKVQRPVKGSKPETYWRLPKDAKRSARD